MFGNKKTKFHPSPQPSPSQVRVEKISQVFTVEVRQNVDRAGDVLERMRENLARAPRLRLLKVPR